MARATTRRQRTKPTQQSQPQPTRQEINSEEEEASDETERENDEEVDERMVVDEPANETTRKANELVRLALFTERRRAHLRREDINKKVLGPHSRSFNAIFDKAQEILKTTFGMELVELQTRPSLDEDPTDPSSQHDELNQARNATVVRKKAATLGTKTYILRSTLDPIIIEQASLTDEQVLEEDIADLPSDSDDDESAYSSRFHGSIISWGSTDQLGALGILYTILALILVSGRVLNDMELRAHLKHLRLSPTSHIPFTSQSTQKSQSLSTYLSTLIRQGYLERVLIGDARNKGKGKAGGTKRGRVALSQANDDDAEDAEGGAAYEWRWGSRAQSEVGEQAVAQFIAEFMVGGEGVHEEDEEEEEEEEGGRRGRGRAGRGRRDAESKLDKMMKGIERAAGGQLADIK